VTVTDTGPLVALVNRNDPNHKVCVAATKRLPAGPLMTSWPCFTEAMYLVFRAGGYSAQLALWKLRSAGRLVLLDLSTAEVDRMAELVDKYHDLPMDMADASVVAAAERLGIQRVFTFDKHFTVYRFADGSAVEVIP
jgi:predicted nucleic acid-binding protein